MEAALKQADQAWANFLTGGSQWVLKCYGGDEAGADGWSVDDVMG